MTFHVTWSNKAQKSNLGQGEKLGQALPAQRQPPGEGDQPRGASPHLRVVPLIKPEAPRLRRGWDLGSEEAGTQTSDKGMELSCPRVQTACTLPYPVYLAVMTQGPRSAPARASRGPSCLAQVAWFRGVVLSATVPTTTGSLQWPVR